MLQVHVVTLLGRTLVEVRETEAAEAMQHWRVTQRMSTGEAEWPADTLGRLDWLISHLRAMADGLYAELHPEPEPSS